jgi:hypothetical protein
VSKYDEKTQDREGGTRLARDNPTMHKHVTPRRLRHDNLKLYKIFKQFWNTYFWQRLRFKFCIAYRKYIHSGYMSGKCNEREINGDDNGARDCKVEKLHV